ncbi:MAG: hypothetical protein HSCHL_1627 [Hydrogenibacillus schlegelii]|uniref:Uncharacterized protein n=1 Tax=Hydrogenibacillus schlegelii TaxID=1484 RepID=A0A2T5G4D7_HYDSH|nr:hypothetical protein [Hydrogenibacillus schlegelii]PTQ51037.1 MAG: hypothetical protein HSCHL_1627 [Hydrogenibacillus schlegelii]
MLTKEALTINQALESILRDPTPLREARLAALAAEVEHRFGHTPEGRMIADGIRSWVAAPEKVGELG